MAASVAAHYAKPTAPYTGHYCTPPTGSMPSACFATTVLKENTPQPSSTSIEQHNFSRIASSAHTQSPKGDVQAKKSAQHLIATDKNNATFSLTLEDLPSSLTKILEDLQGISKSLTDELNESEEAAEYFKSKVTDPSQDPYGNLEKLDVAVSQLRYNNSEFNVIIDAMKAISCFVAAEVMDKTGFQAQVDASERSSTNVRTLLKDAHDNDVLERYHPLLISALDIQETALNALQQAIVV